MKGHFFFTLDLEEWYHLDYLSSSIKEHDVKFINRMDEFFDILKKYNIKITVFVLGELAVKYPELIRKISGMGHEIACHGFDHDLLYNKSDDEFKQQVGKAKEELEKITGKKVLGYRASCFSMDRKKLDILKELGFKYDSSFIRFSQHSLYTDLDLNGFNQIDNLVYEKDGFFEFEIPTLPILKYNIPISGGGYFRLFPYFLYSLLFNRFKKGNENFIFYIHPFEVANPEFQLKGFSFKNKIRFSIGRKKNLNKLNKYFSVYKDEYKFSIFKDYLKL